MTALYSPRPDGMPGNDDAGTMSAWWVLAALGLYPAVPGEDLLALHGPLFRSATLRLAGGRTLRISAPAAARERPYVRGLRVDGRPSRRSWLRFAEIARGARLDFDLSESPSRSWAPAPPPSFGPGG
jgi:putative alpha-1,2-mannosidase